MLMKSNTFTQNIDYFIEEYNIEKQLFKKGQQIRAKGWMSKYEFMSICLWKSRRPKQLYLQNTEGQIKAITSKAFSEDDERAKIEHLIQLKGVETPTASALLSVVYPDEYPIIDIRCVSALKELNYINWTTITSSSWVKYLEIVRGIAKDYGKTPRDVEKGLFAYNRIMLDDDYKNLYD